MHVKDRRSGTALLAVAIAVTAWGFGPLLVNGIGTSPNTVVFWRMWVAQPVMIAMAYITGGRLSWALLKRSSITGWTCGGTPPPGSTHISTVSASPSSLSWKPSLCFRTGSSTIFCSTSSS